jgi:SAM-dependent methyltransferase
MDFPAADLTARVRAQYEAFPYPAYPLFLPLRGQEAYASHSRFAARLLAQHGRAAAVDRDPEPPVLLAGCGDVFPYLAACWEPRRHRLIAMDLSARSLRRARWRCLPRLRPMEWLRADLGDGDSPLPRGLAHVDAYGVLHHLARPDAALARIGRALAPGGTARIMVYNSAARGWIRHLQKAFAALGLDGTEAADRRAARMLLEAVAEASPVLKERLAAMRETLSHPARLVDTFFHAREVRRGAGDWLRALAAAGLAPLGLYDRYGELDDLPNPLLEMPSREALEERIADRRFENDLELYLARMDAFPGAPPEGSGPKSGVEGPWGAPTAPADSALAASMPAASAPGPFPAAAPGDAPGSRARLPSALALRTPPRSWWGYRETCRFPWKARLEVWRHFLANVAGRRRQADAWAARLPARAFQRLGRLGAVFPDECGSAELKALLRSPLEPSMEPPVFPAPAGLRNDRALRARLESLLRAPEARDRDVRRDSAAGPGGSRTGVAEGAGSADGRARTGREARIDLALARLDAAQRP